MDTQHIESNMDVAVALLKALANDRRLQIMCTLVEGEKSVGELEKIVGISQSALSQHLARMRQDGLVKTRRSAQTIYYSTDNANAGKLMLCLHSIFCAEGDKEGLEPASSGISEQR